jgi:hypothetical protein
MMELTEEQTKALENPENTPPRVVNPRTAESFVLLRAEEFGRLKDEGYDDSPWTREERHALAWQAGKHAGCEDLDEYDEIPKVSTKPAGSRGGETSVTPRTVTTVRAPGPVAQCHILNFLSIFLSHG